MSSNKYYSKIHELSKKSSHLSAINNLLEWDQETHMPPAAIHVRALQIEMMSNLVHKHKTSPQFAKALAALIDLKTGEILDDKLTSAQIASLREWRRDYLRGVKLPSSFVKSFAKTTTESSHQWALAKERASFKEFSPYLEKIVSLSRKRADLLGFKEHPYDALLDCFEPEMTTRDLTPLFQRLQSALTLLLKKIKGAGESIKQEFLFKEYSSFKQIRFGEELLKAMGFDSKSSRLDQSSHPFCTGFHPKDTRMTTRIHPSYLLSNIFSVIHEGGHGLYNMGLPEEHYGSPLGEPISLGIDESQSRWWETRIGRSLPFWHCFFPILQKDFPEELKGVTAEEFYKAINVVKPSLIRIEADEVTYSIHIIVRYEIEKSLIEGSLKVKEIPSMWNAKMQEYLGVTPKNDAEGCLQDIHWSLGFIGYFPTYTLGNLYASQFFTAFEKEYPDWKKRVSEEGTLSFIREWLCKHIHQYGRQFTAEGLVRRIAGEPLNERDFVHYLEHKYATLYSLPLRKG